jgi:hypothetical protein
MTQPTDFSIQVPSEDPKKKEKPQDKDKLEGPSKPLKGATKDGEGEEGEELVRPVYISEVIADFCPVRRRPAIEK